VWILPTYRIADQLRIEPDMFDVVVVDEASQAGLEATFLQYPRAADRRHRRRQASVSGAVVSTSST